MKSDPLIGVLVGVLAVSALVSLGLCYLYVQDVRDLRVLQGQVNIINNANAQRAALTALLGEAVEYSKKNPDIDPMLEAVGAKQPRTAPAPANKPASK